MQGQSITKKTVSAAAPTGRDYFIWDRDLKGFGLKVSAAGRKSYIVQYRVGRGRGHPTKRYTIGVDGSPWSAITARAEAQKLLHQAGLGIDPRDVAKKTTRAQVDLRFDDFATRFLDLYAKIEWAPRTYDTHESNIRRWLLPVFRSTPIRTLTRKDVTNVLDRISPRKPALQRNVFVLLRKMLNWAVERGEIPASPMAGMKTPRGAPERHHILADHELVAVAACAPALGSVWSNFVHLLILTGQRRNEVAQMDWSEVDRATGIWTIPAERTKNRRVHHVPLSSMAHIVLDSAAGSEDWPSGGFVLSHRGGRPVSGFSRMKAKLDRVLAEACEEPPAQWCFHDLRRTMATNLQRIGVRFEVTEAIINHVSVTQAGVVSVYQRHDWWDEKREAMELWGERFREMINCWPASLPSSASVPFPVARVSQSSC